MLIKLISDVDFISYIQNYDVMLLNETWVTQKDSLNLDIQGTSCEHFFFFFFFFFLVTNLRVLKRVDLAEEFLCTKKMVLMVK